MKTNDALIKVKDAKMARKIKNDMIEKKEYIKYKIKRPIYLEDYIYIEDDGYDYEESVYTINPTLYQIVVPYAKEFYYQGEKYRVSDAWWEFCNPALGFRQMVSDYQNYFNMDDEMLKYNIVDIRMYNVYAISLLKTLAEMVEYCVEEFGHIEKACD